MLGQGCAHQEKVSPIYMDISGLLHAQPRRLSERHISCMQVGRVKDRRYDDRIEKDSVGWENILRPLHAFNLNQGGNYTMYLVDTIWGDGGSMILRHSPTDSLLGAPIRSLELWFDSRAASEPFFIRGKWREEKYLYEISYDVSATLHKVDGEMLLRDYGVEGFQKVWGYDTLRYDWQLSCTSDGISK